MTQENATDTEVVQSDNRGPGILLKAARKDMNLSTEEIAARMHLSVDIVDTIEANNFNEITAPIFVKGYLRAYAKIVLLDEDEMIQRYLDIYSNEDPPISSTANVAPEISTSDRRVKVITYLVIIGSIVLLAIWWWSKYQDEANVVSLDAQSPTEATQVVVSEGTNVIDLGETTEESASITVIEEVEASTEPPEVAEITENPEPVEISMQNSVNGAVEETEVVQAETTPEPLPEVVAEPQTAEINQADEVPPEESSELAETAEDGGNLQELDTSSSLIDTAPISRSSPAGSDRLSVSASVDSWVEISDASGYRLAYRLLRAQQKLVLTGRAPFTIFFGNGRGIEMTFNDEIVDVISRVRGDNTARLKVGD